MLQNNNIDTKENKQITNQVEEKENYFEKIVNIRLYHRKKVKKFSILIFVSNSIYFILGMLLFFAAYITRFFIYDPDEFWNK